VLIRDIVLMKLNAVGLRGARDLMPARFLVGWRAVWRWLDRVLDPERSYDESHLPGWTRSPLARPPI
jgi:phospholipid/cholesterol/gamma-HCH transport system ATP-binding protein